MEAELEEAGLSGLIGSWRLIALQFTMSDNGEVIDEPIEGISTFDANGRWTMIAVPPTLAGPTSEAERAAIFNRMIAFSGRCEVTGNQINVKADVMSNPALKGLEFTRFFAIDGDRLTITQPEWEHPFFNGRKVIAVVSWERDR